MPATAALALLRSATPEAPPRRSPSCPPWPPAAADAVPNPASHIATPATRPIPARPMGQSRHRARPAPSTDLPGRPRGGAAHRPAAPPPAPRTRCARRTAPPAPCPVASPGGCPARDQERPPPSAPGPRAATKEDRDSEQQACCDYSTLLGTPPPSGLSTATRLPHASVGNSNPTHLRGNVHHLQPLHDRRDMASVPWDGAQRPHASTGPSP